VFDYRKAAEVQTRLSSRLIMEWDNRDIQYVAGADSAYDVQKKLIGVVLVVYKLPKLSLFEIVREIGEVPIPYVPGFLNFREGPVFLKAFRKLGRMPDLTLIDGNGIAHPRKMGLASYVGVILDVSTVGCAKKPFFPYTTPGEERGQYTLFKDNSGEQVGYCLRTQTGVKPLFVSPGHRADFAIAKRVTLELSQYRVPEPLRMAHHLAGQLF